MADNITPQRLSSNLYGRHYHRLNYAIFNYEAIDYSYISL
jgi:hypothetical protein